MHYMSPTYGILELSFGEEHYMEKLTGLDQCSKVDSEQVIIDWIIKSERDGMNMSDAITLNISLRMLLFWILVVDLDVIQSIF